LEREREEIMLGRAGSDDVLLDQDPSISRHHALLKVEDGRYFIYDLRSSSGVFVNDEKLIDGEGRVLADGNHIRIGNYELIFRCSSTVMLHGEKNDASQKSSADTEIGVSS
jgi:pSer/pThr/pTyr-binding forkhead associated (FHA) protein